MPKLTVERLRAVLSYDAETGVFVWRVSSKGTAAGAIAGAKLGTGYTTITVDQERFLAHRLAWFYVHGRWPADQIDHIDGDRRNNAIANLREATNQANQWNRKTKKSYLCEGGTNVGIAWAGSLEHKQAHHRDAPLAYWLRLAEIPGIELHSLQVGPAQNQMSEVAAFGLINDRSPEITNFLDTAKIVAEMDLVVCVDTAVAHLAGAMGVPCWMLVNTQGSDFRWGRGDTTPWYPSLKLFWRSLDEGWQDVMVRVDEELRRLVG